MGLGGALVLGVLVVCSGLSLTACGDDGGDRASLPADAVARVEGKLITKREMRVLVPPSSPQEIRREAVQRAILFEWFKREARRRGIEHDRTPPKLSASEGRTPVIAAQSRYFDLYFALLHASYGPPPSAAAIARYFRVHRQQYARPVRRYVKLVATDTRARAVAARRALEAGETWQAVIARYSTSNAAMVPGSGSTTAEPGRMPPALDSALSSARQGTLSEPIEAERGWYVFKVTDMEPRPPQTFAEARDVVVTQLGMRRQIHARQQLREQLLRRYRPLTVCADDVRLPLCDDSSSADGNGEWRFQL